MINPGNSYDRARRARLAYNNRFSFRNVVNGSMTSSQDVAVIAPVAPTEAIFVTFNQPADTYYDLYLYTSTGYVQAEYDNGTTEIAGYGEPYDVYVGHSFAADDPHGNPRHVKLVACDGRGNKTGTISYLQVVNIDQLINVDLTCCANLTDGLYFAYNGLLGSLQGVVSGADHVGNALSVYSSNLMQADASNFSHIQSLQCGNNYDLTPNNITLPSNITDLGIPSIKCSGALTSAYPSWSNLRSLDISYNALSAVNASVYPQLTSLNVFYNLLSSIDVQGLNLNSLTLTSNRFRNLTRTTLSGVQTLVCNDNASLNTLNASACNMLTQLYCTSNPSLTALNVTGTNLNRLHCYYSALSVLQLPGLSGLNSLLCFNNRLTALDLSDTAIKQLQCQYNALSSLTIGPNNTFTDGIYADHNALRTLNLSGVSATDAIINCSYNALSSINLQNSNTSLLLCDNNRLKSLNARDCSALNLLNCSYNPLTALNVSGLSNLQMLYAGSSNYALSSLDVSGCNALYDVDVSTGGLTALNVSGLSSLQTLRVYSNKIKNLDASGLNRLSFLECTSNLLSSLNLSGCSALSILYSASNALSTLDLSDCASTLQRAYLDANALKAVNLAPLIQLRLLSIDNNQLKTLNASGSNQLEAIYCNNNSISAVNLTGLSALNILATQNNPITSLNLSNLSRLQTVNCAYTSPGGPMTSINLSGCNALSLVYLFNQSLTSINISAFDALRSLYVFQNQLSAINLTNCSNLNYADIRNNKLTATQLNNTFFTLNSGVSAKRMYIGGNPGAGTCNTSIATDRNWTIYS